MVSTNSSRVSVPLEINAAPPTHLSSNATSPRRIHHIYCKQLFDPISLSLLPNRVISVDQDTGLILEVWESALDLNGPPGSLGLPPPQPPSSNDRDQIEIIDLGNLIVLPGFVDVHVHMFLHPYSESSWYTQLTQESTAERTIRATVNARHTLLAGYTTIRDLGTEGAGDADIALRKALATSLIIGPRYYTANRAIVSTGGYGPKGDIHVNQEGVEGVHGAEVADGEDGCLRAVRRQIGAGADWIKVYYRARSRMVNVSPLLAGQAVSLFNRKELKIMIDAAHESNVKVAAHTNSGPQMVETLLDLGVDSIEHAGNLLKPQQRVWQLHDSAISGSSVRNVDAEESLVGQSTLERFARSRTFWVPTLAVYYTMAQTGGADAHATWEAASQTFRYAVHKIGMQNIACGGDTGTFAHGRNALEMVLMRRLGVHWATVLRWGTYNGWECIRGREWEGIYGEERLRKVEGEGFSGGLEREAPFGDIKNGWAADIIGIEGTLDKSPEEFEKAVMEGVKFVMKGGKVYKHNGQPTMASLS
ncbi:hypothetical protein AX16_002263 [Volvariella volvacea WC 439]|nr:hypothetical protein AX16_002263 [Volvariella volvacea WC 439]